MEVNEVLKVHVNNKPTAAPTKPLSVQRWFVCTNGVTTPSDALLRLYCTAGSSAV